MNIIDKKFYDLINSLKNKSIEDIYEEILNKFKGLDTNMQKSFIDYFQKFDYWGKLSIEDNNYEEILNKAVSLKEHLNDYIWLYEKLQDYRSRYVLFAILNNWYNYDFETLRKAREYMFPDYFDFDLIPFNKEHVIVDLGAYIGDTVYSYIDSYGINSYKKIYCYEITKDIYEYLEKNTKKYPNIECRLKAASDQKGIMYLNANSYSESANRININGDEEVETVLIDEDIPDKISMIKMDIEGGEQKALKGCQKHIIQDHPILLISVYHNFEDLWKIPKMIQEMSSKYNFYLRYNGGNFFPTEITLIAIPIL